MPGPSAQRSRLACDSHSGIIRRELGKGLILTQKKKNTQHVVGLTAGWLGTLEQLCRRMCLRKSGVVPTFGAARGRGLFCSVTLRAAPSETWHVRTAQGTWAIGHAAFRGKQAISKFSLPAIA